MTERKTTINGIEYQHTNDVDKDLKHLITSVMESYFHNRPKECFGVASDFSNSELQNYIDCYYCYLSK